jgi:hypothetical protein
MIAVRLYCLVGDEAAERRKKKGSNDSNPEDVIL